MIEGSTSQREKIDAISPSEKNNPTSRYALLSSTNPSEITDLARNLSSSGYILLAPEQTAGHLIKEGIAVEEIIDVLSLQVMGGILFDRDDPESQEEARKLSFKNIEIVACNLPNLSIFFDKPEIDIDLELEMIEAGIMIALKAAAKNHRHVMPIIDPDDWNRIPYSRERTEEDLDFRRELASRVFTYLADCHALFSRQFCRDSI